MNELTNVYTDSLVDFILKNAYIFHELRNRDNIKKLNLSEIKTAKSSLGRLEYLLLERQIAFGSNGFDDEIEEQKNRKEITEQFIRAYKIHSKLENPDDLSEINEAIA
ncbi:hypothetical protein KC669_03850 [Candidatus Dojkabacteria bacterium]|uniref:Uncharacterized protein n=1 Tax=Candidatus Dojkabacteria bacterium TaxID=2099670 RepID=A0A955LAF1_9BACT|nr:hypothetical protein [Candidatus Dojkabacteria bacterium]